MLDTAIYLVTKDIAIRSGLINSRYRVADGRFVLDNKDLSRVRFTTDEYINGLSGVEKVDELRVKTLIAQNGYKMGEDATTPVQENEAVIEPENEQEAVLQEEQATDITEEPTEPSAEEEVEATKEESQQEEEVQEEASEAEEKGDEDEGEEKVNDEPNEEEE